MKFKRLSRFFSLCALLSFSLARAQGLSDADKGKIQQVARGFMDSLAAKELDKVKSLIDGTVEIKYLSKTDLKKKIDAMIQNELSAVDYLHTVSGFNIYKFQKEFEGKTWEMAGKPQISKDVQEEELESGGSKSKYYFLKFQVTVNELNTATMQVKTFSRLVELDFISDKGEFKIFGFII